MVTQYMTVFALNNMNNLIHDQVLTHFILSQYFLNLLATSWAGFKASFDDQMQEKLTINNL